MSKIDGGLRKTFQAALPKVDWTPVETGGTSLGVPDLNGCYKGVEVWIEMKKADHWTVAKVRPAQVAWAERRARHGGRVFMAVRRADDELWLLRSGAPRLLIQGERLTALPPELVLGRWDGGPAQWPWIKVAELLGFLMRNE